MTIATLIVMALCIKLGLWQYHKAEAKESLQKMLEKGMTIAPVDLPAAIDDVEKWRYRRVKFAGTYESRFQILLDNQVEDSVAGFNVLTPIKLENSNQFVLVNRGWIDGRLDRKLPVVEVPLGRQEIVGDIMIPLAKVFTFDAPQQSGNWQQLWQNMDMQRYQKAISADLKPYVVRLDAHSKAGGFSRHWPAPGNRASMHLGYAYQWFGFACTFFVIYLVLNIKKIKS